MTGDIMKTKRKLFFLLLPALFSIISMCGCGYTTGSLLPSHLRTIYVDNFRNKIDIGKEVTEASRYTLYRPGLENDVTNEVVDRFTFDGNLKIANREDADLVLKGSLTGYKQEPLRYDRSDDVEEYRIRITVDMEMTDVANNKILWKEIGFSGESTYMTKGRLRTSEDTARQEAMEDLARRIVERTIECW